MRLNPKAVKPGSLLWSALTLRFLFPVEKSKKKKTKKDKASPHPVPASKISTPFLLNSSAVPRAPPPKPKTPLQIVDGLASKHQLYVWAIQAASTLLAKASSISPVLTT